MKKPGVYRLHFGARTQEAIDAAGGLTAEADVTVLNRASKITDGQKIYVPTVGEQQTAAAVGAAESSASTTPGTGSSSGLVNINTASMEELCTLPGIGEGKARHIISYRESTGKFEQIEDIMKVEGIKEGLFGKIRDLITAG